MINRNTIGFHPNSLLLQAVPLAISHTHATNRFPSTNLIYEVQWTPRGSEAVPERVSEAVGCPSTKVLLQPLVDRIRGVCGTAMTCFDILWDQPLIVGLCQGLFSCQLLECIKPEKTHQALNNFQASKNTWQPLN